MAIYHFSGTIVARSQGRSAVACAAYRAGEKLIDERYQKIQDYSKRQDVVYKNILAPSIVPEWVRNRERLWNEVEKIEIRRDAQLAREFNFSLPKELSLEENIKLAEIFTQRAFVDRGMIADLAIHVDHKSDGAYYHAHLMLTTRAIDNDGFGQKVRAWNSKDLLFEWREQWSESCNRHLALNGHDLKIDHRTLEAQSIALEPQQRIGAVAAQEQMARLAEHQRIVRENGERLLKEPQIALKAITQQQSTFSEHDLARFVNRHTLDAEQFNQVYELVKSQTNIVKLGLDQKQQQRFTTQEMLQLEVKMLKQARDLFEKPSHEITALNKEQLGLSGEQQIAFEYITAVGDLKCLIGYAGTGKSYLLGAARDAWEQQGFRVHGVTLSGIAAESLEGSSNIPSRTLASRSFYWDRGEQLLGSKDVLVVDEAGMLGSRQLARIVEEVTKANAKLILVGDPQQLQAIEAGAAFRAITERVNFVELTEILRQRQEWQQTATKEFAMEHVKAGLDLYAKASHIHTAATKALAKAEMIQLWNDVRLQNPQTSQIMLAYTRDDVKDLNEQARALRQKQGELGQELTFKTFRGDRNFAECDRVYFLKNDRNLGVMNGSLGTVERIDPKALTIRLDAPNRNVEGRGVVVDLDLYNHLDHGYAATIHKAQGVTVDRAYLLASRYLDSHAAYVGMSRHRESADLFYSTEEFPKYSDLVNVLSKNRAKDLSVDYLECNNFAAHRGMEFNQELDLSKEQPSKRPSFIKQEFPFRNMFSNLEEFKTLEQRDQDFNALRAELAQKFGNQQDPTPLDQQIFKLQGFGLAETHDHETTKQMKRFEQMFVNTNRFIKDQERLQAITEIPDLKKNLELDLESKVGLKRNRNVVESQNVVHKLDNLTIEQTQQSTKQQLEPIAETKEIVKDFGLEL